MSADAYAVKIVADGFARGRETSFVGAEKPLTVAETQPVGLGPR